MNQNINGRNKLDEDEDEGMGPRVVIKSPQAFQVFEAVRQQRISTFYLNKIIGEPEEYTGMIHKIRTAAPADIIYIHLNTGGGRLDTGIQIINAMKDSAARIIAVLDSKAYSLGTLIFLAADEFIVHDNCMFMIHNYSSVTGGKGNEQKCELLATEAWFKKLAQKYYLPFLSKDELTMVLNGQDIWMDSDEVKKRLKNMVKLQQEAQDAAEAAPKNRRKASKAKTGVEEGILPVSDIDHNSTEGKSASKTPSIAAHITGATGKARS